ncbi:MAG: hypothetical protein H7Y19_14515 [Luteimonas sp.]|nr:hypothetical protein [Luteimonas sp.]
MDKPLKHTDLLKPGFIENVIENSIWQAKPLSQRPVIELVRWQVMLLPNGDRHFVGWNVTDREGRATTKIVEFDPVTRRGWTFSGREYQLRGPTGRDADGAYTWQRWMQVNGNTSAIDVSEGYQDLIEAAQTRVSESSK